MITTNKNWEKRGENNNSTSNTMSNDGSSIEIIDRSHGDLAVSQNVCKIETEGGKEFAKVFLDQYIFFLTLDGTIFETKYHFQILISNHIRKRLNSFL